MELNSDTPKEDFLEVDSQIPGQNFACLSFLSPEKIIQKKELFILHKFIKDLFKSNKDEIENLSNDDLIKKYEDFSYSNTLALTKEFGEENEFLTSVRGIKVRGVYDTQKEANIRAKVLQRMDNNFNVFVGQVGYWLPWDPNPDEIKDQEYGESELNNLMHEYQKNQEQKDIFYNEQLQQRKKDTRNNKAESDSDSESESTDANKETNSANNNLMESIDPWLHNKEK
jgi:hypothetical protein